MVLINRCVSALAFLALLPAFVLASELSNDIKPTLIIPKVKQAPALENFLGMRPNGKVEEQMVKVEGFIQQRPKDGEPSEQNTQVYLGYDDKNLYVVFVAFDNEPDKVRARMSRRENVFRDDIVQIMLDTFNDQRRAFVFVTNPLGVQWDALWTEGRGFDESFDTLWYSKGRLTDQGYVVWMAFPFKSLRFPSIPDQTWGVIFLREIQRGSAEQSFWPRVSSRIEGRLNQAATLHIKNEISPGRNIQVIPYGTYRSFRLLDKQAPVGPRFVTDGADPDAGIDAKFVVKDNMAVDLTVNPDFSQVESDQPQVTVNQRFEVFFPEKRPFFLENANFFQSPFNLVFTRRIADPQFGLRLTGKAGPYALGALVIDDEAPGKRVVDDDPRRGKRARFSVLRVSRDLFNQSNIGLIYTDREFRGSYNRVGGVDGRVKLNRNWTTNFQAVLSATKTLENVRLFDPAFIIQVNRRGRQFNSHIHYMDIGREFRTQIGFMRRTDVRDLHTMDRYRFRPEGKFLISWGPNIFIQRVWDHNNVRLDAAYFASMNFNFTGQTDFSIGFRKVNERLRPVDFDRLTQNIDFSQHNWNLQFQTSFIDEFRLRAEMNFGNGINFVPLSGQIPVLADRVDGRIELNLLPITQLRIDNNYIFFQLNERNSGERIFKNQILRSRWNWQFNRKFSLRLIFQYDVTTANQNFTSLETTKNFNVDFLITYLVNPWTALFVGVNSNYQNLDLISTRRGLNVVRTQNDFLNDARQVFVKYSYLFRF